ncbi:MAG: hypothetical protein GX066_01430 [Clostridiaceae bacterium]|nr:hypothetical protein [Clostridiaceae bacterium]
MKRKMRFLSAILVMTMLMSVLPSFILPTNVKAVNPYLPLWEHLPDGEPKVFEDPDNPGKYRVYIIGSHDVRYTSYCGPDIRAWSAPVEDLTNWRDEGPIFTYYIDGQWDVMYAPDLVEVRRRDGTKEYYLYPHSRGANRIAMVCKSDRPTGPFVPINMTEDGRRTVPGSILGFDPAVWIEYIDDPSDPDYEIGFRAYAYWGFAGSNEKSWACELDQNTMYSVRPGTQAIQYFMPCSSSYGNINDPPGTTYPYIYPDEDITKFNFFEASSIRKIGNKYIMIYSGYSGPDYGLSSTNSALRYAYGDTPLGPWRSGGVLVDSRAPVLNRDGSSLQTSYPGHNTHGSLLEINGNWYVFYHRAPRGYGYARQPMVAPVKITWDEKPVAEGGKVVIRAFDPYSEDNTWTAKDSRGNEYTGAEVTSEGFEIFGLDPYKYYSAGYACYMSNPNTQQDSFDIWDNNMPITNVRNGHIIGYKYFGFGGLSADLAAKYGLKPFEGTKPGNNTKFNLFLTPRTTNSFKINVWMDGPYDTPAWNGKKIGEIVVPANSEQVVTKFSVDVSEFVDYADKKHAIFLVAEGGSGNLFDLIGLGFSSDTKDIDYVAPPAISIQVDGVPLTLPTTPVRSTNANGIVGYDLYELSYTLPSSTTGIPVITASSVDPSVKITISQPPVQNGVAVVRFNKDGVVKTYRVQLSNSSGSVPYNGAEVPDVQAVEQAEKIIGNIIGVPDEDYATPEEKAAKAEAVLKANKEIAALGVDIDVSYADGSFGLKISRGNTSMTIAPVTVGYYPIEGFELSDSTITIKDRMTAQLTATVTPSYAYTGGIQWQSSDPDVATVSDTGLVTGIKPGKAIITAKTVEGDFSAQCEVNVIQRTAVTGITLNKNEILFEGFKTETLTASVIPSDADFKRVRFESSNPEVVRLSNENFNPQTGVSSVTVEALNLGTAVITARAEDNDEITAVCNVRVVNVAPRITITSSKTATFPEVSLRSTITDDGFPSSNLDITWSLVSGPGEVQFVNAKAANTKATVTALGDYEFKLTVSDGDLTATANITVTVKEAPNGGGDVAWYRFDELSGAVAIDSSGRENDGTIIGATGDRAQGIFGNALRLSGANNQHMKLPNGIVSDLDDFTIATWVNIERMDTWARIFDFGDDQNNYMFLTVRASNNNRPRFAIKVNGSSEQVLDAGAGYTLSENKWYHIAITRQGNTARIYLNGELAGTNTNMTFKPSDLGFTTNNMIGNSQWPDPLYQGRIDEFSIFSYALSAEQIKALTITSVPEIEVRTTKGVEPELPETVDVTYMEDISGTAAVTWPEIDPCAYANVGTFSVTGTIKGSALPVKANVKVIDPSSALEQITITGTFDADRLIPDKVLTATVTARNDSLEDYNVLVIVALYDGNRMVNVSYISKLLPAEGGEEKITAGFRLPSDVTGHTARVFVWEGETLDDTSMQPLSKVISLPAQN